MESETKEQHIERIESKIHDMRMLADYHTLTAAHWLEEIGRYEMLLKRVRAENEKDE